MPATENHRGTRALGGPGATRVEHVLAFNGTTGDAAEAEEIAEAVTELRNYARETQHEKIIRALSISLALLMQGREEQADGLIE